MQVVHEPNSHLGKFSNSKLHTSTLSMMKPSAYFASTLNYVNNAKTSGLLVFSCNVVFIPFFSPKNNLQQRCILLESCKIMETSMGGFFFDNLKNRWQKLLSIFTYNFTKTYLNGYFHMKLPLQERVIRLIN